ncbi:MAG TPA: glyceraldehyde 3-phosphate dehydrogenase NAD-binding domain-containing protein [Acidimicrobiia bacterium]|nr:glyceraldehyde 3-phosphate dehydrogenase NAD-binding domain-containing protein [Acidimicrobiia bacterium]
MNRIGLFGFGRIGRNAFRLLVEHKELQVAAIADIDDPAGLTYLLKYDSIYGRFPKPVSYDNGTLQVEDDSIAFLTTKAPSDIDWKSLGVDLVVDATSNYRTMEAAQAHLRSGAKRVVVASTPEKPGDIPVLLRGINDSLLNSGAEIIALGSNTSNAVAPILRILDNALGIERAFFTTVHAMTNDQRLADVPGTGFRTSRAAGENIIPAETNSPEILSQVMPELGGKISAMALNVPVADGSTIDLTALVNQPTSKEAVNAAVAAAASGRFKDLIEFTADPIVSSDVKSSTYSGIFDSLSTMVVEETMVKTITWFNNGWGYSARIVEVLEEMSRTPNGGRE